ncbi:MAG: ribonuclease [Oscillospiraceae bacterium]|nr:ribonuclease [Oscillospiraceae bacterium]
MKIKNKWLRLALLVLVLALLAFSYWQKADAPAPSEPAALTLVTDAPAGEEASLDEDGSYTSAADVALYLHAYGRLPANFITKAEAEQAGWPGGSLEKYCPGKCIGGDRFGNREGKLPDAPGRVWYECDINTLGASKRGAERLVFSNDGLIYYSPDHYESFTRLY